MVGGDSNSEMIREPISDDKKWVCLSYSGSCSRRYITNDGSFLSPFVWSMIHKA